MNHSAGNVIWIGVILLCLEITWSQGKPAADDSDVTSAKRQQQQQQRNDQQFNFQVGDKTFVFVYTVPGVSGAQARERCQNLRNIVDFDWRGWPTYLRGDLASSNETWTKMGKVPSKPAKHTHRVVHYYGSSSLLDEFKYIIRFIEYEKIEADQFQSGDKLLVRNEAGKCVYLTSWEKIETKACDSQNTRFVCQMEKES